MNSLDLIADGIRDEDNFVILGHVEPDGDCIGSVFSLKWALDQLGKNSLVLLDSFPEEFSFLGTSEDEYRVNIEGLNWPEVNFIALDSGDQHRLGGGAEITSDNLLINIDHHPGNPGYGDLNYVNSDAAAVGEIIYELINLLDLKVDKKIGTGIATAILADTGGLRYQNTSSHIFRILADLIDMGVDIYQVNQAVFSSYSAAAVKLTGMALSTLTLSQDQKIAWIKVEQSVLQEADAELEESSGLVSYPRDIKGVEVGLAFYELEDGNTRVSLRSNNYCPVNEIASLFGGGGHARAAGCTVESGLDESIETVIKRVQEYV